MKKQWVLCYIQILIRSKDLPVEEPSKPTNRLLQSAYRLYKLWKGSRASSPSKGIILGRKIEDVSQRDTRSALSMVGMSTWCCAPRVDAWGSLPRSLIYRDSTGRRSAFRRWPCRSPSSSASVGSTPMSTSDRSVDTRAIVASRSEIGAHLKREFRFSDRKYARPRGIKPDLWARRGEAPRGLL